METTKMRAVELKAVLKKQAAREGKIDLGDPAYRFTIWSENRSYFYYEDHTEYDHEMAPRLGELMLRDKSRVAILDILEDRLYLYSVEIG
jgi:hypothetical protein